MLEFKLLLFFYKFYSQQELSNSYLLKMQLIQNNLPSHLPEKTFHFLTGNSITCLSWKTDIKLLKSKLN